VVQENLDGITLNRTHLLLVYANTTDFLREKINYYKENMDALVTARKATDPDINAVNIKHIFMSH
jgi:ribosomal protein L30E